MYCSKCGKENVDTATYCNACGNHLISPTASIQEKVTTFPQASPQLKKMSVFLLIILVIITGGIYYPVWFLIRRNQINNLQSKEKIGTGVFTFAIVAIAIYILTCFAHIVVGAATATVLRTLLFILWLVVLIILLLQCFKARDILIEHFNWHMQKGIFFSRALTLFFQIYYLQYKINRF